MPRKVTRTVAVIEPGPFEDETLYTPAEVAERLKVPKRRIQDWYYRGVFDSEDIVRLPTGWRIYGRGVNKVTE